MAESKLQQISEGNLTSSNHKEWRADLNRWTGYGLLSVSAVASVVAWAPSILGSGEFSEELNKRVSQYGIEILLGGAAALSTQIYRGKNHNPKIVIATSAVAGAAALGGAFGLGYDVFSDKAFGKEQICLEPCWIDKKREIDRLNGVIAGSVSGGATALISYGGALFANGRRQYPENSYRVDLSKNERSDKD